MSKAAKKPIIIISSMRGDLLADVDFENLDSYITESELDNEDDPPSVAVLRLLAIIMSRFLVTFSWQSEYTFSDILMHHIRNFTDIYAYHAELQIKEGAPSEEIEDLQRLAQSIKNDIITVYTDNDGDIGLKINPDIGNQTSETEAATNNANNYFSIMEALTPALAYAAGDALNHGADERDVLDHLLNCFTKAISSALPNTYVSADTDPPRKSALDRTPPKTNKNGPLPS